MMMFRSSLTSAARHLARHKAYVTIQIAGLAVGMACCLFTLLYVQDELSYDRFHEQADRIYRINAVSENPEGRFFRTRLPPPVAPALQATYPEVENVVRIAPRPRTLIRVGDQIAYEDHFYFTDAAFLDVFSFPLLRGDPATALAQPGTVLLTRSTAQTYFGDVDPIGQVIQVEDSVALTVTGILADLPSNSHLHIDFLTTLETRGLAQVGWLEALRHE